MLKIERCNYCRFFKWIPGTRLCDPVEERSRFRCYNPEAVRKNGSFRIINRKLAWAGKFPKWCPLEDYVIFRENNKI
jgi:hypothetical protein